MLVQDAIQFCKDAWPGEGVTVRNIKGVCEVVGKSGNVMGRAFNWRSALQQAYKPFLDKKLKADAEKWEARQKDQADFLEFMWDKLRPEFEAWKDRRDLQKVVADEPRDQSPEPGRVEAGEAQLVQVDAEAQRPGPAGPPRLVLAGDE